MVELAIAGNDRFAVDRREIDRDGPSYTVDTLEDLHAARVAAGASPDLTLILSAEAFLGLMTWREPRRVMELARVVVAPRDGYPAAGPAFLAEHLPDLADRATFLDGPRLRLSASELRARAAAGRSLRYLVPDAVAAYIGDHALYQTPPEDPAIVTEPAMPDANDPRPRRAPTAAQARQGRAGHRAPAARTRPADRRAGRGQEGRRHRPARSRRA